MKAFIKCISYYLPNNKVTNEEIVKDFPEWSVEKIADKVGVNNRHVAIDETATDMAIKSAEKLFLENDIERESIDFILLCTQSPDFFLPSSACIIQDKLNLRTNIGAFDFNLGCSGYVYGLAVAKGLIIAGLANNVLFLTSETYNQYIHPRDKGNRTIFGDAATATIISTDGFAEIGKFSLGTDGKGCNNLIVKTGASRYPKPLNDIVMDENGNPISSDYLYMNGGKIFSFSKKNIPICVNDTLKSNKLQDTDIKLYIFHQANKFMLDFLRNKIGIDEDRFFINMWEIGNTVSNSIPIAIVDAMNKNQLDGNVLICGFGVGYSWGGTVLTIK